jgi:hypothetical protein
MFQNMPKPVHVPDYSCLLSAVYLPFICRLSAVFLYELAAPWQYFEIAFNSSNMIQ